jgi:hypothetical protein
MPRTTLRLVVDGDAEQSDSLTRELSNEISQLRGIALGKPEQLPTSTDARGDLSLVTIIVAAVSSGGALSALIGTISSYLMRDRRTEVELQRPDGSKMRISSQAFTPKQILEMLHELFSHELFSVDKQ